MNEICSALIVGLIQGVLNLIVRLLGNRLAANKIVALLIPLIIIIFTIWAIVSAVWSTVHQ